MMTALLILVAVVLVLALVGMLVQVARGSLCATVWWWCGGAEQLLKILGEVVTGILEGLSNG
jgi:hypothetical protein